VAMAPFEAPGTAAWIKTVIEATVKMFAPINTEHWAFPIGARSDLGIELLAM